MRNDGKLRRWAPVALAALLVALVFALGLGKKQKTWVNMTEGLLSFDHGTAWSLERGDGYGVMNDGPGFDLPSGTYRFKWIAQTDADNRVRITSANGARIEPSEAVIRSDGYQDELVFEILDDADDVNIEFVFENGTSLSVLDGRLYTPFYRDDAFTFAFAALGLCVLWVLWQKGYMTAERRGRLVLVAMAVIYASTPSLKENLNLVYDTPFHIARICNLADGLRMGQFPVRLGAYSYNGYGAVTSVLYPDLLLYPCALMMMAGASIQYVLNVYCIALNILAAAAMYICAKRIYGDKWMATCASILYTLAIYRFTDVYIRGAIGEATAMSLLPLFVLGLWEILYGDKRRWPLLVFSAAGIFLSHMLATLMCALCAACMCVLGAVRLIRERRLGALIAACACTALLCAYELVPFIQYNADGVGAQVLQTFMSEAMAPAQLFLLGTGDMAVDPRDPHLHGMAIELGLPLVIGMMLTLYSAVTQKREARTRDALLAFAGAAFFAFMSTTAFPWAHLNKLTGGLASFIQFPFRLMMLTCFFAALTGAYGYLRVFDGQRRELLVIAVLVVAVIAGLPSYTDQTFNFDYVEFGQGGYANSIYPEYNLPGTNLAATTDRSVHTQGDVTITAYEKESARIRAQIDAKTDAQIALPLFGFRGYRAQLNGGDVAWTLGENNRLTVAEPAGTSGTLTVWFAGEPIWRVADAVSLLTLAALLGLCLHRRRKAHAAARGIAGHVSKTQEQGTYR